MVQRKDIMDYYDDPLPENIKGSKLFNIALKYEGNGLLNQAIETYSDAVNNGSVEAAINLGVILMYRSRVESCHAAGLFMYAASRGYSSGYRNLAQMYIKKILPGGNERAAEYYLRAAEMGDARAQCNYAIMCKSGKGVKKNNGECLAWLQKSANNGYYRAQALLAEMYYKGDGIYKDVDAAVEWYYKAAENGSPVAAYTLAMMYMEGNEVEKNTEFGRKMLQRAVELGYSKAAFELGKIAEAEEDYLTAVMLYSTGAEKGEPGCISKLYELGYYDKISSVNSARLDHEYEPDS